MSTVVLDASVVVAALTDSGDDGPWSRDQLPPVGGVAPQLLLVEVTSALRRGAAKGSISSDTAQIARVELLQLPIRLIPFEPYADRVWELRENVTTQDAWYVAIAEALDAPLVTLDRRLARATGPRCTFRCPGLE